MRSKSRSEPRGKQERQHCPRNVHYFSRQIHLRRMLLKPIGEYINRLVHICCRQFFSATLQTKRTGLVKSPLENGSEGPLMLPTTCKRLGLMTVASNRTVLFWELHNFILAVLQKKNLWGEPMEGCTQFEFASFFATSSQLTRVLKRTLFWIRT